MTVPLYPAWRSRTVRATVLLGLSLAASSALARDELNIDVSAQAGIATNPLLGVEPTPTTSTLTLGIRPTWVDRNEFTTLQLSGYAEVAFYSAGYGTTGNATVQGSGNHRLSERASISGSVGYINSIVGSFNGIGGPLSVPILDMPVAGAVPRTGSVPTTGTAFSPATGLGLPFEITDPSLGTVGRRQQTYMASGEFVTALSARDQLMASVATAANRTSGVGASDFNSVTPGISYSRVLGDRFSVGARFTAGFIDYLGTGLGDAAIYQPALTVTRGISERLTLTASAGAAITTIKGDAGQTRSTFSLNGAADLCRRDPRWSACFNAARQTVPSTFQGVRTQTTIGASGSYRLSEREDLSFSGRYSHAGDPIQRQTIGARDGSTDFVNASAGYARRIGPALFATATVGYTKAFDTLQEREANLTALFGVTYRLLRR